MKYLIGILITAFAGYIYTQHIKREVKYDRYNSNKGKALEVDTVIDYGVGNSLYKGKI